MALRIYAIERYYINDNRNTVPTWDIDTTHTFPFEYNNNTRPYIPYPCIVPFLLLPPKKKKENVTKGFERSSSGDTSSFFFFFFFFFFLFVFGVRDFDGHIRAISAKRYLRFGVFRYEKQNQRETKSLL